MKHTPIPAVLPLTLLAASLTLLAPRAARAAAPTSYTLQPLVTLGDQVADVTVSKTADLEIGALNDRGQIAFVAENAAGGGMLLQYAKGQFLPIAVVGRDAPDGTWAAGSGVYSPVSMNQQGDIAFSTTATIGGTTGLGTFWWNFQSRKVTLVAFQGMAAVNNLTFVSGSSSDALSPSINNRDEIAFAADVKNAAGQTRSGAFLMGQDGQLQAVALPDQVLPGGARVQYAYPTGINDAGAVAFITRAGPGSPPNGAYLWENGAITPIAVAGAQVAGLGKVTQVYPGVSLNKDGSAVLILRRGGGWGLFRWAGGQLSRWRVGNQSTNGDLTVPGGVVQTIGPFFHAYNDAGQFALQVQLTNGATGAYLLDPDGTLSPILKSGDPTPLGTITAVGQWSPSGGTLGVGLNNKGQVATLVKIGAGPTTLVLLTPSAP